MKSLKEYSYSTSPYELYTFLSQKIVCGEIDNFGEIIEMLYQLPRDKRIRWLYPKLFFLIRSIYWGFLKDLDKNQFPEMWKTFVIEDPEFPGVGKLKRNSKILSLFCAMLDIHGYTAFCQKAGRNLSMLHLLDNCIQEDILGIARKNGIICQRSRGDEIVLLGADASALLFTVMGIVDYFGRRKVIQNKAFQNTRMGNKIILPDMKVSVGISGGTKYTPLVITVNGDLSGHLINSAARLQSHANNLAPKDTKILLMSQVFGKLKKEIDLSKDVRDKLSGIYFRNTGLVELKGTQLTVVDVIVRKEEMYKQAMEKRFEDLNLALKNSEWENRIFEIALDLVKIAVTNMNNFSVSLPSNEVVKNRDLFALCSKALGEFNNNNQIHNALDKLDDICNIVQHIPDFDHLLIKYLQDVLQGYRHLKTFYMEELETILNERAESLLPSHMRAIYNKAAKEAETYRKLRELALEHPKIGNRKAIWLKVVRDKKSELSK